MAIWEEKKMKKKTVPTRHAILMAGIQEEKLSLIHISEPKRRS